MPVGNTGIPKESVAWCKAQNDEQSQQEVTLKLYFHFLGVCFVLMLDRMYTLDEITKVIFFPLAVLFL